MTKLIFIYFDFKQLIVLEADALMHVLGLMVSQRNAKEKLHLIVFYS